MNLHAVLLHLSPRFIRLVTSGSPRNEQILRLSHAYIDSGASDPAVELKKMAGRN